MVPEKRLVRETSDNQDYLVQRLQSVLNAAARMTFHLKRSDHITDALVSLHWLRVSERIRFKVAVLTYKVLNGSAPPYLEPLTRVADVSGSTLRRHTPAGRSVLQAVHRRQLSFSSCHCPNLEHSARQRSFGINCSVLPA